ncbi:uncharacterized protein LOC117554950 [Gymnodraco acuticeps]|uniref:Uncharacterized protein LOC117554950 n=1 Tax=Gymnodraco acuticeps TaxID=8218 RepID=A0A6P8VGS8_GYMAC|nr:uncharacterized protein LOC117554950 [Gymnodraco acuticeps]
MYEFPCLLDGTGSGYGAWYTPGRNHKPATGFLEERLRNVRKRMRMLKRPRHQEQQEEQTVPSTPEYDVPPEKLLEMVEWMKVNRYPVSQVEDYMNQTALHRGNWIRSNGSKSLPETLTEFPRLLDNPGMISQDFQQLHPEAVGKLFQNWATMSDRILTYAQREGKLSLVFDDMTPDRALKVLPTLLPPSVYKSGGKVHRPTIEESRKSFINIQPVGTNMVHYLQTVERTQPFPHILCLGDDMTTCQTFTIVSDNAIETDTLLGAVDLCFKAFFVLDLNYTKQCLPTWEFIQQAVYEIDGHESSNVKFLRTSIAALA